MILNGRSTPMPGEAREISLIALLRARGIDPKRRGIAVALNGAVVRRRDWPRTVVAHADRVEIVTALPGG